MGRKNTTRWHYHGTRICKAADNHLRGMVICDTCVELLLAEDDADDLGGFFLRSYSSARTQTCQCCNAVLPRENLGPRDPDCRYDDSLTEYVCEGYTGPFYKDYADDPDRTCKMEEEKPQRKE